MKISDLRYEFYHLAEFVFHFIWPWSGVEVPPWLLSVASTSRGWTYQNLNLIDQFVFSKTAVIAGARDEQTSKGGRILSDEAAMEEYEWGATEQVSTKKVTVLSWLSNYRINQSMQTEIFPFFYRFSGFRERKTQIEKDIGRTDRCPFSSKLMFSTRFHENKLGAILSLRGKTIPMLLFLKKFWWLTWCTTLTLVMSRWTLKFLIVFLHVACAIWISP